jgi:NAD(P)H-hydrate epimerase
MTGNPGMTVGGTGDVLAGLCGGFLAQGQSLVQSAKNAAFIAGKCGDRLLEERKWYSFIASDLLDEIETVETKLKNNKFLK